MMRSRTATIAAFACACTALVLTPGATASETGGAAFPDGESVTIDPPQDVLHGESATIRGRATSAGALVRVEQSDDRRGPIVVARARAGAGGFYTTTWRPRHIGRFRFRAVEEARPRARSATSSASPETQVTVYLPAVATWYGPGFYGRRTACGQLLRPTLVGVAHRTLPCGTRVAIHYAGRSIVASVVDRGPYANGAAWDLTAAAARALRLSVTDRIGAVTLRPR